MWLTLHGVATITLKYNDTTFIKCSLPKQCITLYYSNLSAE